MKINMTKWLNNIVFSNARYAMPILTFPVVGSLGYSVNDAVTNGHTQYEVVKTVADRYPDHIAALMFMDLSVEAEAFGAKTLYREDEVPTIIGHLLKDIEDVENLEIPPVGHMRTGEYLKAAQLAVQNITDRPVLAGTIGPFSLAGRLLDMNEIMVQAIIDPENTHLLLEKCTQFIVDYVKAYKALGANGVVLAEPAAGLMSCDMCDEFSSQYVKRIVDETQDENFIVVLHNCGNTGKQISSLVSTGAKCLHLGNSVNMPDILPQIPWGQIAMGNLDPTTCFLMSTPEEVARKTAELLQQTANYKNFVISSGCDIPAKTPIENVDAFFDEVANFNQLYFTAIS